MKKLFICIICILSITAFAKDKTLHLTNMTGASKASGDCGGFSAWLDLDTKQGKFTGGKFNEFEGDCNKSPLEIVKINHNPKTGALTFYANYVTDNTYIKFDGTYFYKGPAIKGVVYQISKDTLRPIDEYKRDVKLKGIKK